MTLLTCDMGVAKGKGTHDVRTCLACKCNLRLEWVRIWIVKKVLLWVNLDGSVKIEIGERLVALVAGKERNTY